VVDASTRRGDTDAGVADGEVEPDPSIVCRLRFRRHREQDVALLGELHRVAEQVDDDLAQPGHVADDGRRAALVDDVKQLDTRRRSLGAQEIECRLHALLEHQGLMLQLELPRLDLGEVEDVVDDAQEGLAAGADRRGEVALLGGQGGVEEQAGHADHRVHRGPDLVAHGGEEGGLRLCCRLGVLLGLAQLGLGPQPVGDVPAGDHPQPLAVELHGPDGEAEGEGRAIDPLGRLLPAFPAPGLLRVDGHQPVDGDADDAGVGHGAEHRLRRRVRFHDVPVAVDDQNGLVNCGADGAEAGLVEAHTGQGLGHLDRGELGLGDAREVVEHSAVGLAELAGPYVHEAHGADHVGPRPAEGAAGVEPYAGLAGQGAVGELGHGEGVGEDQHLVAEDGLGAEGAMAGVLPHQRAYAGLGPQPVGIDQIDHGDRHGEDPRRQPGQAVEPLFGGGVEQPERSQHVQAGLLLRRLPSLPAVLSRSVGHGSLLLRGVGCS
jgi:hypothetical protein